MTKFLICPEEITDERTQGIEPLFQLNAGSYAPEIATRVLNLTVVHVFSIVVEGPGMSPPGLLKD